MTSTRLPPSADEALTPPSRFGRAWAERLRDVPTRAPLHALAVVPGDTVLVVTAHPDDETIGLGATIASLAETGVRVELLCATAGEAAYDGAGIRAPHLAERRRDELAAAAAVLGIEAVEVVGLRDGHLAEHEEALATVVGLRLARDAAIRHVAALWREDPHPDHAAVGRAAARAARRHGRPVSGFPVWAFHWSDPATLLTRDRSATVLETGPDAGARRRQAMRCHASQVTAPAPGTGPVVPPEVATWSTELLVAM